MYTYSIIITRNGQEIKKFLDFLPVLSIYFSIECQLLLEVKSMQIDLEDEKMRNFEINSVLLKSYVFNCKHTLMYRCRKTLLSAVKYIYRISRKAGA